jgi:hypothetical protein
MSVRRRNKGGGDGRRTKKILIPVHSLGESVRSRLPSCLRTRDERRILVRIEPMDVPRRIRATLRPEILRGGGPLSEGKSCTWLTVVAWIYNLAVLFYGAAFLLFASLVILEEAEPAWRRSVVVNFFLSCLIGFVVSDLAVVSLVACLPMRGRRTRKPLDYICGFLAEVDLD